MEGIEDAWPRLYNFLSAHGLLKSFIFDPDII